MALECIEVQTEPQSWRTFAGASGHVVLKPDLFVRVAAPGGVYEHRYLLEIDMDTESAATVRSKALRYFEHYRSGREQADHGVYPRVLWVVPTRKRAERVATVLQTLPVGAARLFGVCGFDETIEVVCAEAFE
jgi:hypothetical protein